MGCPLLVAAPTERTCLLVHRRERSKTVEDVLYTPLPIIEKGAPKAEERGVMSLISPGELQDGPFCRRSWGVKTDCPDV